MEENLSRKERERLFRKQEIIIAAIPLFAEKGFSNTTLEEIAAQAEFGKGTLYNYFQGKEEIYQSILEDVIETNDKIALEADSQAATAMEFFENYTRNVFKFCLNNKNSFLVFVREITEINSEYKEIIHNSVIKKNQQIKSIFLKRIEEGIRKKELRKYDPEKIIMAYNSLIFSYIQCLITCFNNEINEEKEADFILSVFFNGIINNQQ